MTTPTPRTDAAAVNAHDGLPVTRVSADFARQLEGELAAAQEELERVRDKCNEHYMALAAAHEARQRAEALAEKINQILLPDPHDEREVSAEWQVKAIRAAIDAAREGK